MEPVSLNKRGEAPSERSTISVSMYMIGIKYTCLWQWGPPCNSPPGSGHSQNVPQMMPDGALFSCHNPSASCPCPEKVFPEMLYITTLAYHLCVEPSECSHISRGGWVQYTYGGLILYIISDTHIIYISLAPTIKLTCVFLGPICCSGCFGCQSDENWTAQ